MFADHEYRVIPTAHKELWTILARVFLFLLTYSICDILIVSFGDIYVLYGAIAKIRKKHISSLILPSEIDIKWVHRFYKYFLIS